MRANATTAADDCVQAAVAQHLTLTATLCAGPPLDGIGAICCYGPR